MSITSVFMVLFITIMTAATVLLVVEEIVETKIYNKMMSEHYAEIERIYREWQQECIEKLKETSDEESND